MNTNLRPSPKLILAGVAGLCLLAPITAHASLVSDAADSTALLGQSTKRQAKFEFTVYCDPVNAEGMGSGYSRAGQRGSKTPRFGMRPPQCVLKADQSGGSFDCECADGKKHEGKFSDKEALEMHEGVVDSFDWCENKVKEVCKIETPTMKSVCENEHGVCGITAYGRNAGKDYSDLKQECYCKDDQSWTASTPTVSGFELDQATLDKACKSEVARCAPDQVSTQASDAIELPDEILSHPRGMGCMNNHGTCRVFAYKDKFTTNCGCFATPDEEEGVEAPVVLGSLKAMLLTCREELAYCEEETDTDEEKEPEDEPEDAEEGTGGEVEPGDVGDDQPGAGNAQPRPKVLPIGCSLDGSGFGGLWGLLALPGLCLLTRRRRD